MPATLSAHPTLTPPTTLGSHTLPYGRAAQSALQTHAGSSSRRSHASIGETVKIINGTVRRARGAFATVVAGNSIVLTDASTLQPFQSIGLSHVVQPCTPPLVVLQSAGKDVTLRTTYIGVAAQTGAGSELWAWREVVTSKSTSVSDANLERSVLSLSSMAVSLHPLASEEVLVKVEDGSYVIVAASSKSSERQVDLSLVAERRQPDAAATRTVVHSMSVLDAAASAQLFGGQLPQEDLLATIVTLASGDRKLGQASASTDAASSKDKQRRRRKTAIEVIDDAEKVAGREAVKPSGGVFLEVEVVLASGEERFRQSGSEKLNCIKNAADLLDAHFYHDGSLSLLTRSGQILLANATASPSHRLTVSAARSLPIRHISPSPFPSSPAALVRLSPSHLLVILQSKDGPSKGKMAALIWDTELEAVLVASDWSSPTVAGLADSEQQVTLSMVRVGGSQVIVQGNVWGQVQGASAATVLTVFWAVPFSIPSGSVLRHALGKAALTDTWSQGGSHEEIKATTSSSTTTNAATKAGLDPRQGALLQTLQSLSDSAAKSGSTASSLDKDISKRATEMDEAFAKWTSEETTRLRSALERNQAHNELVEAREAAEAEAAAGSDSDASEGDARTKSAGTQQQLAQRQRKKKDSQAGKIQLSYSFVAALLAVALPPQTPSSPPRPYARQIISYLLTRRAVSCGMLSGTEQGLIQRLRAREDWVQILAAIRSVPDVAEVELVSLLGELLVRRSKQGSDEAGGSSAGWARPHLLETYLAQFVSLAVSRPLLRSTLHGHVSDAQDVTTLIAIVTQWLKLRAKEPLDLHGLDGEGNVDEAGNKASGIRRKRNGAGASSTGPKTPPTADLLQFSTDLLDVYFPLLLQTPSSHPALRSLAKTLVAHLGICSSLATLKGPLDAFARLDADRKRIADLQRSVAHTGRNAVGGQGQGQLRGSAAGATVSARAETGGGLAAVANGGKTARLQALEASALVGPYTVEVLEI